MNNLNESHSRSVTKGITWRIIASITTMALAYALTGDVEFMAKIGVLEVIAKLLFYYVHERVWGRITWGKESASGQRVPANE